MVRKRGLEPPRPCGHKLLRLARLPIPPLPLSETDPGGIAPLYTRDQRAAHTAVVHPPVVVVAGVQDGGSLAGTDASIVSSTNGSRTRSARRRIAVRP